MSSSSEGVMPRGSRPKSARSKSPAQRENFHALYARELKTITAADLLGLERELLGRADAATKRATAAAAKPAAESLPETASAARADKGPAADDELLRLAERWGALAALGSAIAGEKSDAAPVSEKPAPETLEASRVASAAQKVAESLRSMQTPGSQGASRGASGRPASTPLRSAAKGSLREDARAVARARNVAEDLEAYERIEKQPESPGFTVQLDQATGEPFVSFVESDRVGLALSGGGIRSATFNLGLLQGLNHHNVLSLVDYLATVSGGGYIGGWWSAWKFRNAATHVEQIPVPPQHPTRVATAPGFARHEANEVRHLREFSNFLVPRAGFFDADLWEGIAAILSGVTVSLFLAAALLLGAGSVWLASVWLLEWINGGTGLAAAVAMAICTFAVLQVSETRWQRSAGLLGRDDVRRGNATVLLLTLFVSIVAGLLSVLCNSWLHYDFSLKAVPVVWGEFVHKGVAPRVRAGDYFWAAGPALVWGTVPALLLVIRPLLDRLIWSGDGVIAAAFARVLGRLLRLTLFWLLFGATWELARFLEEQLRTAGWLGIAGSLVAAAEAFRRVRNWVTVSPTEARTGSIASKLKPVVPQLLAYFVIFCGLVLVMGGLVQLVQRPLAELWQVPAAVSGILLLLLWLIDPEQLGLRAFYRRRIVRTYLGASNPAAAEQSTGPTEACYNRCAVEHPEDDLPLAQLQSGETPYRPIHLVCCAANDLSGDHLGNLGRGSQSAVLSPLGIALGNNWRPDLAVSLGAALTASAAAFNTLMGSVSRQLGPGVTFLLAAMNLRLGMWVAHPAAPRQSQRQWLPGWRMLTEFWSDSRSGMILPPPGERAPLTPAAPVVHLSDGAHFENLGLYELVRRHCRYIIVSDCGADPESAFDDLGNALRRIREDFGVEIELDVAPLKPGPNGHAAQHMVVGTIHYDAQCDYDQGILLYFKPTLTGDEPDDVLQYKGRNTAFPQETTVDQFYDEKQWEAYRRLGEHAARAALRFLEGDSVTSLSRYQLFSDAYWQWYPTLRDQEQKMLEQTERFSRVLTELRQSGETRLIEELLFDTNRAAPPGAPPTLSGREGLLMMEIAQVMEDAFVALRLDRTWTSPLHSGWMNLYYRWTRAAVFRDWWPCLESLYSRDFRNFLNDHCRLGQFTPGHAEPATRTVASTTQRELEDLELYAWYRERKRTPARSAPRHYLLEFQHPHGQTMPVGFLECGIAPSSATSTGPVAQWFADELFVVPSLRGTNIAGAFLPEVIRTLHTSERVVQVEVELPTRQADGSPLRTDEAHRAYRSDLVRLYKSLGFKLRKERDRQLLVYRV